MSYKTHRRLNHDCFYHAICVKLPSSRQVSLGCVTLVSRPEEYVCQYPTLSRGFIVLRTVLAASFATLKLSPRIEPL